MRVAVSPGNAGGDAGQNNRAAGRPSALIASSRAAAGRGRYPHVVSDTPRTPDPGSHRHLPESQRLRQPLPAEAEIVLTGADLSIADVEAVARSGQRVRLGDDARARMAEARSVVERLVAAGEIVYGVTTGFGDLATTVIDPADSARLQENLLVSHAVGVGEPLPRDVVRAMLLLRANTLALGHSGCRPLLVDRLCDLLRLGIHPVVPSQGSVGASGDLAPLAHLALPLTGRGRVEVDGRFLEAADALEAAGIEPLELQAKEGLALLNGTQMMSAIGALVSADAARLARTASVAAALSCEALLGTDVAYAAAYQLARPHPGQIAVAGRDALAAARLNADGQPPSFGSQGSGSVLAALRIPASSRTAPWTCGTHARRPRRRAELGHGQPARLPSGERGRCHGRSHRRRSGDQRRQFPRRAGGPRPGLRQARHLRARGDLGAAYRASWSMRDSTAVCRPSSPTAAASSRG